MFAFSSRVFQTESYKKIVRKSEIEGKYVIAIPAKSVFHKILLQLSNQIVDITYCLSYCLKSTA